MKHYLAFGAVISAISIASVASAQATAPQAATASADDGAGLQEIVVTAQRRSENLQRVPITVTTISPQALATSGVTVMTSLSTSVPGLVTQELAGSFTPFIRGIGTNQTTIGAESSVAVYIDGVYQGSKAGNVFELNDIGRIEVLKGPQGTLFGRNATGGAISIVTRGPTEGLNVEANVG